MTRRARWARTAALVCASSLLAVVAWPALCDGISSVAVSSGASSGAPGTTHVASAGLARRRTPRSGRRVFALRARRGAARRRPHLRRHHQRGSHPPARTGRPRPRGRIDRHLPPTTRPRPSRTAPSPVLRCLPSATAVGRCRDAPAGTSHRSDPRRGSSHGGTRCLERSSSPTTCTPPWLASPPRASRSSGGPHLPTHPRSAPLRRPATHLAPARPGNRPTAACAAGRVGPPAG